MKQNGKARANLPPQGVELDVSVFDDEKPLPLDTIGGIMQRISKINAQGRKESGRRVQCPSTIATGKRSVNVTFCTLDEGHEGDHVGYRKRWPNTTTQQKAEAGR